MINGQRVISREVTAINAPPPSPCPLLYSPPPGAHRTVQYSQVAMPCPSPRSHSQHIVRYPLLAIALHTITIDHTTAFVLLGCSCPLSATAAGCQDGLEQRLVRIYERTRASMSNRGPLDSTTMRRLSAFKHGHGIFRQKFHIPATYWGLPSGAAGRGPARRVDPPQPSAAHEYFC